MPNALGQNYLSDYVAELQALGFDAFQPADLETYINRGYMYVARKSQWYWEQTSDPFHIDPGAAYVPLWPLTSGELPYFRSLDKVYITTAQYAGKLEPLSDDDFTDQWLSQDLTQVAARGTPSWYMVWNQLLYILPPPSVPMDFIAHYTRRIAPMTHTTPGTTDVPITPPHLDEAILLAAKVRCHTRAQELSLAQTAQAELMDVFDDMADDDTEIMDEQLDRVSPDDTWL